MKLLRRSKTGSELIKAKKGVRKKLFYFIFVVVIAALALGAYFLDDFSKRLKSSSKDYATESVLAITKNWNYKELLSRSSKELVDKTGIQELTKLFNVYGERLGNLKTLLDSQGEIRIRMTSQGILITADYKVQALYEKGRATIETGLAYDRNRKWCLDRFSVISPVLSSVKDDRTPKTKPEEKTVPGSKFAESKTKDEKSLDMEDFSYTSKGRRDPFFAVLLSERKRAVREKSEKGGYELEELKIVGVLKTDKERFAMMEDKQGNGMLFKKGDHINRNLWIVDIADDKIIYGYRLKNDIRTIVMDLPGKK